jgi:O-methyltransferase/methyltransferase family protein
MESHMESHDAAPPASPQALRDLLNGYRVTQLLYVAAKLEIADLLGEGPKTSDELASATGVQADALYRVLRALASLGVFRENDLRQFTVTPLAELLQRDHPQTLWGWTIMTGEEPYRAWADLLSTVMTGAPAFERVYGASRFEYLGQHPEASALFNESMSENVRDRAAAIVGSYDFPATGTVVDVGGGYGVLLSAVLRAQPSLQGILFDHPQVVAGATPRLEAAGVSDRCAVVGGDFFAGVPAGGTVYVLSKVIHDWDDERSIAILRSCRDALEGDAKVVLVESVIEAGNDPSWAKFLDVQMLVMNGGRERTIEEYRRLFVAAGLQLTRVIPTGVEDNLIEAERAVEASAP